MQTSARSADQFKRTNSNGWTPANHRTSSDSEVLSQLFLTLFNNFQKWKLWPTCSLNFSEWPSGGSQWGIPQCDQFDNCSRQLQPSKVFKESKEIDKQISRLLQWAPSADCLSGLSEWAQWGLFSEVPSTSNDLQRFPTISWSVLKRPLRRLKN